MPGQLSQAELRSRLSQAKKTQAAAKREIGPLQKAFLDSLVTDPKARSEAEDYRKAVAGHIDAARQVANLEFTLQKRQAA